jgi:hypothetical protein
MNLTDPWKKTFGSKFKFESVTAGARFKEEGNTATSRTQALPRKCFELDLATQRVG